MRILPVLGFLILATVGHAQAWKDNYERGLTLAKANDWSAARMAFKDALKTRPNDESVPTPFPGPITERRVWRGGAPYSANLLAAYSAIRQAARLEEKAAQDALLKEAQIELENSLTKRQAGSNAVFLLGEVYTMLGLADKRVELQQKGINRNWREDTEIIAPEQIAIVNPTGNSATTPTNPPTNPQTNPPTNPPTNPQTNPPVNPNAGTVSQAPVVGGVQTLSNKYAFIIGNSESGLGELNLPFAVNDAQLVAQEINMYGGYPKENIVVVENATADVMRQKMTELAARIPAKATVMIYFSGVGSNVNDRDYLAGTDATGLLDTAHMLSKAELYQAFAAREAIVFGFFQANRPERTPTRVFGYELPTAGAYSQCQATFAGGSVYSLVRNGKPVGVYTDAFVAVLREFRTNQIPIIEFGWKVFYRARRGENGTTGGSAVQAPTLPELNLLGSDARF